MRLNVDVPRLLTELEIAGRRVGRTEIWARCPHRDHREKEPSWSVIADPANPRNGQHNCFGCGWGGGAVELVAEVRRIRRSEAWVWIVDKGLEADASPEALAGVTLKLTDRISDGVEVPSSVIIGRPVARWPTPARRYAESRGLTDEVVERWGAGYSVDGRLAGRICFPISDGHGRVVGYSARTFVGGEPRYLGPPKTKRGVLFGESRWPPFSERCPGPLAVCEGVFNALALEAVGVEHVAAMCGSAIDSDQILKIASWPSVIIATDNDLAGDKVARRLEVVMGSRVDVSRMLFPDGLDASDLLAEDEGRLREIWVSAVRGLRSASGIRPSAGKG